MFGPVFKGKQFISSRGCSLPKELGTWQKGICRVTGVFGEGRNSVRCTIAILEVFEEIFDTL